MELDVNDLFGDDVSIEVIDALLRKPVYVDFAMLYQVSFLNTTSSLVTHLVKSRPRSSLKWYNAHTRGSRKYPIFELADENENMARVGLSALFLPKKNIENANILEIAAVTNGRIINSGSGFKFPIV